MRISCFIVFGALLLPIVVAEIEDPNRFEEVITTEEPTTSHNVSSVPEQKTEKQQLQQSQDPDKARNVRATKRISSFPFSSADNPWTSLEIFDKTPIFFEHSLEDKEKPKLVIVEPFLRVKKKQNGFWGWLEKIFSENKEKKGPGPLIGPIKVPGLGEYVYIRAIEPVEDESERVVIHLKTSNYALGSSEKEIKLPSPLSSGSSFGSSFGSFDTAHELPLESSSFQTIYSPHFSSGEVGDLFDKSHLSSHPSWSTFSSPSVSLTSGTEDIFSSPSFFRKHSTEADGSEFSGSLLKDAENHQQHPTWAQSYGRGSLYGSYENLKPDRDQGLFASKNNQQLSSAREDIDKVQGVQNSQLEISQDADSLPLYPPLFNGSLGHSNSNAKEQLYVSNGRGNQNSGSPSRYSAHHPGLSAYRTQSGIIFSTNTNSSDDKLVEKYVNSDGIREVEAPNLYQSENKGRYQYSEGDGKENAEQTKSDTSRVENSKKAKTYQTLDYENYGIKDSDSGKSENIEESVSSMNNSTREVVKQLYATYPWTYKVSKGRAVIPKTSENEEKESSESSASNSKIQVRPESRKTSLQRNRSRFTVDGSLQKDVRIDLRSKKRFKQNQNSEIKKSENQTLENLKLENENAGKRKCDLQTDTSKVISEIDVPEFVNDTNVLKTEEKSRIESNNSSVEDNSKCPKEKKEESSEKEMKETMTSEELKTFFIEESKRFEDVLKAVEENSKAMKEESKSVEKELKSIKEESKSVEELKSLKEEIKLPKEETKSNKEESESTKEQKFSETGKTKTEPALKTDNKTSKENKLVIIPSNRLTNKTRFDNRTKKLTKENKEEIKKSNSSVRVGIRKLVLQAPKILSVGDHSNKKLKNNTHSAKLNSTLTTEVPKTTPPTHISRIYAKNRFNDRLKSNLKITKPEEKTEKKDKSVQEEKRGKEETSGKEEKVVKEENKSQEMTKSQDSVSKVEKIKEEFHMRMSKLFPKARNSKSKNESEVIVAFENESAIRNSTQIAQ